MKKLWYGIIVAVLLIVAGVGYYRVSSVGHANTQQATTVGTYALTLSKGGQPETIDVPVKTQQSLLKQVEKVWQTQAKGGLITSIDGVDQDASLHKYWLFKINGQLSQKGAADVIPVKGDKIEFYLGDLK